jgi:hypothetical protein
MSEPKIYGQISKVMNEIGVIGKNNKNAAQGYTFRGIDDMYNELNQHLADAKIFFTSEILSKEREEREAKNGGNLIYTVLRIKWTVFAEDGSSITTETMGEAMDSGDKSANKAMSASYKYALMQIFCIPTKEIKDTEHETYEVKPKVAPMKPQAPTKDYEIDMVKFRATILQSGTDSQKLVEHYGVLSIDEMTPQQIVEAYGMMNKKIAKMANNVSSA